MNETLNLYFQYSEAYNPTRQEETQW